MSINIIACIARNRAIGLNNQLLYHIQADMARFKSLTTGHTIIMGRHTYDSLPHGALPCRRNIVLSRHIQSLPDAEVSPSLETALSLCQSADTIYIIGGAEVYGQAMGLAGRLHLTVVDDRPTHADTFFPPFEDAFRPVFTVWHEKSEDCPYAFAFTEYIRNSP